MCGIFAYIGEKTATPLLIDGLKKLEYRGYDSAGICTLDNGEFFIKKRMGKIKQLEAALGKTLLDGRIGIAHTRWATHGEPNELNAHPHACCNKQIVIAHNGIIENYRALKNLLEDEGHTFHSQTDSEVVAHLIEKFYEGDLEEAATKALELVEGAFGLAILHRGEKRIIAARRGSPLVLGIGNKEMFVASDVAPILKYTKKVTYLNDDEIASVSKEGYRVKKLDGQEVESKIHEVQWSIDQIEKKGHKHFMLKEIFEQPESVANTIRGRLKNEAIKLSAEFSPEKIKKVIVTACGTSWHSGLIGKQLIESVARIPVEVDYASEFRYRNPIIEPSDLLIAVSQSGETADTLAAIKEAKSKNAGTFGMVNVVGSTIAREVDSGMYLRAGPEIGVASTKAFTCQITALLLFALYLRQSQGKRISERMLKEIAALPDKIRTTLKNSEDIRKLAEKFKDARNFLYLGRGMNFPVALEGALKLKEISYIHAEGYPAAEMKHGPIALIDENMPAVFVCPHDGTYEKVLSNMEELRARGGKIIAVTDEIDEKVKTLAEDIILIPKSKEEMTPMISVIPLQLLAYHIADLKGLDVDQPRNLAKSVTVE